MSPEQDIKLFLCSPAPQGVFSASPVRQWYATWQAFTGRQWAGDYSFLPSTLTGDDLETAKQEIISASGVTIDDLLRDDSIRIYIVVTTFFISLIVETYGNLKGKSGKSINILKINIINLLRLMYSIRFEDKLILVNSLFPLNAPECITVS